MNAIGLTPRLPWRAPVNIRSPMPRKPRLDFPDAVHHVMNRGARRAALFAEAWVCQLFLAVLSELPARFNVRILAYAIMPNHYHLLLECPDGNLSRAMQYLGGEFTQRLNRIQAWDGPVFRGRFLSRLVDSDAYFAHVLAYIHLNPVRANLAKTAHAARWTSHAALVGRERRPAWLAAGTIERLFGDRKTYLDYLASCLGDAPPQPPGWDPEHVWAAPRRPPALPVAPRPAVDVDALLLTVATAASVPLAELRHARSGRRGNPARAFAAWWLGRRTTLTNGQIAEHLGCSAARVSQLRREVPRQERRFAAISRRVETLPLPPSSPPPSSLPSFPPPRPAPAPTCVRSPAPPAHASLDFRYSWTPEASLVLRDAACRTPLSEDATTPGSAARPAPPKPATEPGLALPVQRRVPDDRDTLRSALTEISAPPRTLAPAPPTPDRPRDTLPRCSPSSSAAPP